MNRLGFLKRLLIGGLAIAPLGRAIASTLGNPPAPRPGYRLQTSPIRGYHYRCEPADLTRLSVGATLTLAAQPDNPHDPYAVCVFQGSKHIGYLPRENNHHVSRLLRQGARLTATINSIHPERYHWQPLILDIHLHL
jgi:hypothetical protein